MAGYNTKPQVQSKLDLNSRSYEQAMLYRHSKRNQRHIMKDTIVHLAGSHTCRKNTAQFEGERSCSAPIHTFELCPSSPNHWSLLISPSSPGRLFPFLLAFPQVHMFPSFLGAHSSAGLPLSPVIRAHISAAPNPLIATVLQLGQNLTANTLCT